MKKGKPSKKKTLKDDIQEEIDRLDNLVEEYLPYKNILSTIQKGMLAGSKKNPDWQSRLRATQIAIDLRCMQRLIDTSKTHLEISGNADMEIQIISNAEKKAKERLKRLSK